MKKITKFTLLSLSGLYALHTWRMELILCNSSLVGMVLCLLILALPFMSPAQTHQESEPNNRFSEADSISLSGKILGHLFPSNDDDYYQFELPDRGIVDIQVTRVPSNVLVRLKIYDQDFQELNYENGNFGADVSMRTQLCQTGSYYVRLFSLEQSATLPYQLSIHIDSIEQEDCLPTSILEDPNSDLIEEVQLFPNPMFDRLNISVPNELLMHARLSIEIGNTLGQIILVHSLNIPEITLSVGHLPKGIYIMRLKSEQETISLSLVKKG